MGEKDTIEELGRDRGVNGLPKSATLKRLLECGLARLTRQRLLLLLMMLLL